VLVSLTPGHREPTNGGQLAKEDFKTCLRIASSGTDDYELVVLEFSATRGHRLIIWGIYTCRWFADQIATGENMSLDQAKVAAEA
jgi:hypothetical protein